MSNHQPTQVHATLLHGLGADGRAFQRFARLLPESWVIYTPDLLGHGTAPKPATGYSLLDHARYVGSVLSSGVNSFNVLIGHSLGAAIAAAFASTDEARGALDMIVLLDPPARSDDDAGGERIRRMFSARRSGDLERVVAELWPEESEALRRWTVDTWSSMAMGVMDEFDRDWQRFSDRISTPTILIHGDVDKGGAGPEGADGIRSARSVRICGAGHWLHATHAIETAAAVSGAVEAGVAWRNS